MTTADVHTARMDDICSGAGDDGRVVRDLLEHLGDKWTLLVVGMLEDGPIRYSELKNRVPGISQRMLTLTLKKLERDGLVRRESFPEIPPRVEYDLTPLGHTLLPPALAFATWARGSSGEILARRAEFDARVTR
ncbi:winged helix-turn-helix transcriptional regulator [Cryobacterium zhongshanensis]|uniref:Helix-turn-helix transcriptional regulator n=1 Tax=Cryobacterium zhongshanensis TaxID=2928153 RepID=A0AA41QSQ0_9MICO|nr:helix-turn-helix domain-containing protein [Cryobacterium zhongshanensis]MCI4656951.1 helix-turn-helix transcriptional regulator [Cryobacterium zhongshanensis]